MMNAANLRELLTAAVDGVLTPADRRTVQRLLRESDAARKLYVQLKADAERLKKLPRMSAPADLADNVMSTIQDRALSPTPLPPTRPARRFDWSAMPVWANIAAAAAVLVVISAGSYLYFAASHDYFASRDPGPVAKGPAPGKVNGDTRVPTPDRRDEAPRPRSIAPAPETIAHRPREIGPEVGPPPRVTDDGLLTGPPREMEEIQPFQLDKIRVSRLFAIHDLAGDEAARTRLAAEMKKDELIRLDLFCDSPPRALEQVKAALKERAITLYTDAFAAEQLKRKSPPEVMIFTEALTPDEVVRLIAALGSEDKKAAGGFETLVAAPFLPADLTKLSRLLGVPGLDAKPAKDKPTIDIRKPLPEGTANQVADMLAKMGSGSRPARAQRVAVAVSYSPANPQPAASREIRQFLDLRGERRPDAKPLMLVLRTTR
jgi:hypothetical protein